jgi:hypothetical protein
MIDGKAAACSTVTILAKGYNNNFEFVLCHLCTNRLVTEIEQKKRIHTHTAECEFHWECALGYDTTPKCRCHAGYCRKGNKLSKGGAKYEKKEWHYQCICLDEDKPVYFY